MTRRAAAVLVIAAIAGTSLVAGAHRRAPAVASGVADPVTVRDTVASEAEIRDLDLAFYQRRAAEDPWSAADRARLSGLHLQRARETGSFTDYLRAESVAVSAVRIRASRNEEAFSNLAAARLAMHDFGGALRAANALVAQAPGDPGYRSLLGEVLLELGRYDEAAAAFRGVVSGTDRLTIMARLSRWYEVTGRLADARNTMRYALRRAMNQRNVTREQQAWFHLRLGELEFKAGAPERAESLFTRGLERFPDDYRLLGALARTAAARRDWLAAIDAGERAVAVQLDPATLGVLSESYAALGDSSRAASWARAMRAGALSQPGPIHRAWGLFLLDHGIDAREVLARARQDLASRRDVYGFDLTAWALHALGRDEEAWPLMQRALGQGTEDALLWRHASDIANGRGDESSARDFAARAAALEPSRAAPR